MTIHECRIIYPGYALKEMELSKGMPVDKKAESEKISVPTTDHHSVSALTPTRERSGDGG